MKKNVFALTIISAAFSASALAADIPVTSCGTTLSASGNYSLANDLVACPATAITITAKNVRLNLNDYSISGSNVGTGIEVKSTSGVQIVDGNISGFVDGIDLNKTSKVFIGNVKVSNNSVNGIYLNTASNNFISGNTVIDNAKGVFLYAASNNNKLIGNTISNNGAAIMAADGVTVVRAADDGLQINTSNNTTVTGNTIAGNGEDGLEVKDSNSNVILGNTAHDNGRNGIYLRIKATTSTSKNSVTNNVALHNGGSGIVDLAGAVGNSLTNNIALNNNTHPDPLVGFADVSELNVKKDEACANKWQANSFDGIVDSGINCVK